MSKSVQLASYTISWDHFELSTMFEKDSACSLLWVDTNTWVCNNSTCSWIDSELLSDELDHRCKWCTLGNRQSISIWLKTCSANFHYKHRLIILTCGKANLCARHLWSWMLLFIKAMALPQLVLSLVELKQRHLLRCFLPLLENFKIIIIVIKIINGWRTKKSRVVVS